MADETDSTSRAHGAAADFGTPASGTPAAYCQECGRALTTGTLRRVNNGVFCMPCAARFHVPGAWQPVGAGSVPGSVPGAAAGSATTSPNPGLAATLGFIPGVGAMYNGQYAKAAMHLIVFVVLLTLADNLNWVFYWLVWGWIFYQVFDAFHTAKARRDGLTLPNPFGWNDIGERFGFSSPAPPPTVPTGATPAAHVRPPAPWADYRRAETPEAVPTVSRPLEAMPRPPSENPYAAPYAPPVPPPYVPPVPQQPVAHSPMSVPYTPTYTGAGVEQSRMGASPESLRRFPVGALWLIALGFLLLLGNLAPGLQLSGRWFTPLLLVFAAGFSGARRWQQLHRAAAVSGKSPKIACAMISPTVLLTIAVLMGLQAGDILALRRSWPILLVVWGGMLLLQRASASYQIYPQPEVTDTAPPVPVRSTSGTGSLGL